MARGWESKSVEEQQAENRQPSPTGKRLSPPQAAAKRNLDALLLARKRVQADLAATTAAARREMLQRSLDDLNAKIAALLKVQPS